MLVSSVISRGVGVLALVVLSGCAAKVVSSSPRTVVVRAPDAAIAESQQLADTECNKHDRHARLIARPTMTSAEFVFDCVR